MLEDGCKENCFVVRMMCKEKKIRVYYSAEIQKGLLMGIRKKGCMEGKAASRCVR